MLYENIVICNGIKLVVEISGYISIYAINIYFGKSQPEPATGFHYSSAKTRYSYTQHTYIIRYTLLHKTHLIYYFYWPPVCNHYCHSGNLLSLLYTGLIQITYSAFQLKYSFGKLVYSWLFYTFILLCT